MVFRSFRAALFALSAVFGTAAASAPSLGHAAPAFVLPDATGKEFTLRSFGGRPLVINVFASWCPPCRQELPRIVSAAKAHARSVTFVGVDEQEPMTMALAFIARMKLPYPVLFDQGQFAASYGAQSLPETIFVDAHGKIAAVVHGAISAPDLARDLAKVEAANAMPART